jgi:hypothetical protein
VEHFGAFGKKFAHPTALKFNIHHILMGHGHKLQTFPTQQPGQNAAMTLM